MIKRLLVGLTAGLLGVLVGASVPAQADHLKPTSSPVVGSWIGKVHGAQYEDHMYQFHPDGTMDGVNPTNVQEKPDGSGVNDSKAVGAWHMERGRVIGTFIELNANQATHKAVDNLTVKFDLQVHGNHLTGTAKVFVGAEQVPDASFDFQRIV